MSKLGFTEGKYVWSLSEIFNSTEFDTVEDALKDATQDEGTGAIVNIGKIKAVDIKSLINTHRIIDDAQEKVYDQCGEAAEDFLSDITEQQEAEIQDVFAIAFEDWLERNHLMPEFYAVVDIKEYTTKENENGNHS